LSMSSLYCIMMSCVHAAMQDMPVNGVAASG